MARISSAGYVTAVLQFLQAYNRGDLDACEALLDPEVEWHGAVAYRGRRDVRGMLELLAERWVSPRCRPDDFREAGGRVLMIVCFFEGAPGGPPGEQRQSWLAEMSDEGLIRRVMSYTSAAEAARAFEALSNKVHA
jgi:ketosteroid isomerase-like protein